MLDNIKRLRPECLTCLGKRYIDKYPESATEEEKIEYIRTTFRILAEASEYEAAPVVVARISSLRDKMFGVKDDFSEIKKYFNNLMLEKEENISNKIWTSNEPLLLSIQYAMAGNYIDFGVMDKVKEEKLNEILLNTSQISVNNEEYNNFVKDLETCKSIVYLTDNCGEIVMDKLLIKTIMKLFPNVSITAMVRGGYVLNDATMEDAAQVELTECVKVITNGNNIAGTWEAALSQEAKEFIENADIIISKGQANYETLRYCGRNIYYLFLCKCEMLANDCGVPKFTGMFVNDRHICGISM